MVCGPQLSPMLWLGCMKIWIPIILLAIFTNACTTETPVDARDDQAVKTGKADSSVDECSHDQVVVMLNEFTTDADFLKSSGVHTQAANHLAAYRAGEDELRGTEDDIFFNGIHEVDAVPYVGPVAMEALIASVEDRCPIIKTHEVVFSPQPYGDSHLQKTIDLIDAAHSSLDIAMYSFRDHSLLDALARARDRGISIRAILESARKDRNDPEGTISALVEELGIDVVWVNKIMHHKFVIIDGPREYLFDGYEGILVTGSGNWSYSAGTKYDESTLIIRGNGELLLRFQREFNLLWAHARDFVWVEDLFSFDSMAIAEEAIVDEPTSEALFTSANFKTSVTSYGPTFSIESGKNEISDRMVELINEAENSIHIASGHMRLRPVYEALIARHEADPEMDIRVYLDAQEYVSLWGQEKQVAKQQLCLEDAGDSESKKQKCLDRGFRYSYALPGRDRPQIQVLLLSLAL